MGHFKIGVVKLVVILGTTLAVIASVNHFLING